MNTETLNESILPDGARVFVRNAFLFGDIRSRVGRIQGFNISVEDQDLYGGPRLDYQVKIGNESYWISASQIEGFLVGVK